MMLSKGQTIIQGTYLFLFIFMTWGMVGNIKLGVKTPTITLIVYGIVCFLTTGKILYWIKKGEF